MTIVTTSVSSRAGKGGQPSLIQSRNIAAVSFVLLGPSLATASEASWYAERSAVLANGSAIDPALLLRESGTLPAAGGARLALRLVAMLVAPRSPAYVGRPIGKAPVPQDPGDEKPEATRFLRSLGRLSLGPLTGLASHLMPP